MKKLIIAALLSTITCSPAFAINNDLAKSSLEVDKLTTQVKNKPNDTSLLFLLAQAYEKEGRFDEATNIYQKIIELKPNDEAAYLNLGVIYDNQGKTQLAIDTYKNGSKNIKNNSNILQNLGSLYISQKMYDEAIDSYKTALTDKKDSVIYALMGHAYESMGKNDEAEKIYKEGINIKPVNTAVYINYGSFLYKEKRYEEAVKLYQTGLDTPGKVFNKSMLYSGIARNLSQLGKYDDAITNLKLSIPASTNPTEKSLNYMSLGNAYKVKGKNDLAINAFEESIKLSPKDAYSYYNLGELYTESKLYDKAVGTYTNALNTIDENKDLIFYGLAELFEKKGDLAQAKSNYQKACDLSNTAACTWLQKH